MGEGFIQILVIGFFIIISMMDGAARKRRKEAARLGLVPTPDEFPEAADDLGHVGESSEESESRVPTDLWEEIAAMARGDVPASPQEPPAILGPSSMDDPNSEMEAWTAPEQDASAKTQLADLQSGYLHPDQAASHQEHAHEKHAQVALPSSPLPEELPHEFVPHSPEQPSEPKKKKRLAQQPGSLLAGVRSGTKSSLQEAIVLAEVLRPPVTLRDSGWKPLF